MIRTILALLALTTAAHAQTPCLPSLDAFSAALGSRFGEMVQSVGALPNGQALIVFANPVTGTWTIVITQPDGQACSPASGERFTTVKAGEPA